MKSEKISRIFFVISLIFLFCSFLNSYIFRASFFTNTESVMTTVSIKEKYIKAGKIDLGSEIKTEFNIKNSGNNDLFINMVKVYCSCSSTTKINEAISPGDSVKVLVEYEKKIPGYFFTDVLTYGNFDGSPLILSFEGYLVSNNQL